MTNEIVQSRVFKNSYRDSVELMRVAAEIERLQGVQRASLVMGTPANRALLSDAGLLSGDAETAGPNDLVAAVAARDAEYASLALDRASGLLVSQKEAGEGERETMEAPHTIYAAVEELPEANLAVISTPGSYATAESLKALKHGMNVFLFSDNVPVQDEIELKSLALKKRLLMMGPDCGTAILDGVPVGFANVVQSGRIGLIGASGTGLQQVSCLIDRLGSGISQAIGVGGRDLDERVGGPMMLSALERLSADPGTDVIVLLSKPPAAAVAKKVLNAVKGSNKPVVVNFLGGDLDAVRASGAVAAFSLEDAAVEAVALVSGVLSSSLDLGEATNSGTAEVREQVDSLAPGQWRIRGLYSGGTLAYEARLLLKQSLGSEYAARQEILDLGDDEYTVGRPHPMIDPRLRNEHVVAAAEDPSTAVILLDVVLGYAANDNPAGALAPVIEQARNRAAQDGRHLLFVASVCGTRADPQDLQVQEELLRSAGVLLAPSNARAVRMAAAVVKNRQPAREKESQAA